MDWNTDIIEEFRANKGWVGGRFAASSAALASPGCADWYRAREGDERERIWERQKRDMPGFAEYEVRTARRIPVVILELSEAPSSSAG